MGAGRRHLRYDTAEEYFEIDEKSEIASIALRAKSCKVEGLDGLPHVQSIEASVPPAAERQT